jgi:hypothetical protein
LDSEVSDDLGQQDSADEQECHAEPSDLGRLCGTATRDFAGSQDTAAQVQVAQAHDRQNGVHVVHDAHNGTLPDTGNNSVTRRPIFTAELAAAL